TFYGIEDRFREAAGIPLQRYFQIMSMFLGHLDNNMNFDRRWLTRSGLCSQLRNYRADAERLLFDAWSQTPEVYISWWPAGRRSDQRRHSCLPSTTCHSALVPSSRHVRESSSVQ